MVISDVYIHKLINCSYPNNPFNPAQYFPEFKDLPFESELDSDNEIYGAVRSLLYNIGLDCENFGTEAWNPFGTLVKSGQKVVIKPNLVKGNHPLGPEGVISMITHASVIRPVIDYLILATQGNISISIVDVPLQSSDWEEIIEISGLNSLVTYYHSKGIEIKLLDLRKEISVFNPENVICKRYRNPFMTDNDYIAVDIGKYSSLMDIIEHSKRFEITDYGYGTVPEHHNHAKNAYLIPKEILNADLFINIPKLKTHRKAGLTCAMKNLIGINGDKSWIAHHRRGLKSQGGDEFEKMYLGVLMRERLWNFLKTNKLGILFATILKKVFKLFFWKGKSYEEISMNYDGDKYREGSWYGNDTIWRCIKDLNKIITYSDKTGKISKSNNRNYLCIVDAVLSGEGEGPMEHTPLKTGIVFGGLNPVYIDYTASIIMGFDYRLIPSIKESLVNSEILPLAYKSANEINILSNKDIQQCLYKFKPSNGWKLIYNTLNNPKINNIHNT